MPGELEVYGSIGGSSGTPQSEAALPTGATSLRFKTNDNNTVDNNDPIPIPATGSLTRSYWKTIFLRCREAPSQMINNFQMYGGGTAGFGTGITVYYGNDYPTKTRTVTTGYRPATGTPGTNGTELNSTNYPGVGTLVNLFSHTAAEPKVFMDSDFISEEGNIINAVGETTNYLVLQAEIAPGATPGTKSPQTITIVYDEI